MLMKEIVFATNNAHKLEEISSILKDKFVLKNLTDIACFEDIPETGQTLKENALQKARYVFSKFGTDCFADDTGLEVEALNDAPGVFSARYAGEQRNAEDNMNLLLENMVGIQNRNAAFKTVIALILDGKEYLFEGEVKGTILTEKKGEKGFGYDPIFKPHGYEKTFAELSPDIKNKISHRALATQKLVAFFNHTIY